MCLGRASLDLFGDNVGASFADTRKFSAYVGGSPTNVCIAAQRLGLNTAMITALGGDYTSDFILKFLQDEGISTDYVAVKPGMQTNTVMVALQPPDAMQFVALHANNADLELTIDDVLAAPLDATDALLFSGMCLLQDPSRSATQYAAEHAHRHGATIYMDLDYRTKMWSDPRIYGVTARLTLVLVDVVIGTEEEVMTAAGQDDLDTAIAILRDLVRVAVVVKRGAKGASVYTCDGETIDMPAFKVDVVNFLGAGDAFAGTFIYAHQNGKTWAEALRLANGAGAMIVSQHGTGNVMPTLDTLQAFIDSFADSAP